MIEKHALSFLIMSTYLMERNIKLFSLVGKYLTSRIFFFFNLKKWLDSPLNEDLYYFKTE